MADSTSVEIGRRIRLGRKLRTMSQGELGKALGVTFQQIQKYEKGANNVTADKMPALAEALGVEVSYFYEGLTGPADAPGFAEAPARFDMAMFDERGGMRLNRAFLAIDDTRVRELVVDLVERIAEVTRK